MNKFKVAVACAVLSIGAFAHAEIKANDLAHKAFAGGDENGPASLKINSDLSWSLAVNNGSRVFSGPSVVTTVGYDGAGTFVILMDDNNSQVVRLGTRAATIGDLDKLEYDELELKLEK